MQNIIKRLISQLVTISMIFSMIVSSALPANADNTGSVFISTNNPDATYSVSKLDGTIMGTGKGVEEKQFVLDSSDGLGTGYQIQFDALTGYTSPVPNPYYFNLVTGDALHIGPSQNDPYKTGIYTAVSGNPTGKVTIYTNHPDGSFSVSKLDGTVVGTGSGVEPNIFILDASDGAGTGYKIQFNPISGYNSPDPNPYYFNLVSGADITLGPDQTAPLKTGFYTPGIPATIQINVQNELAQPINDGSWILYTCTNASDLSSCTDIYASGTATKTLTNAPVGIYGLKFNLTTGYSAAAVLSLNPQTLGSGALTFTLQYTTGGVEVNQLGANGILKLYGPTPATISNAIYKEPASLPGIYTLAIDSMPALGGYVIDYVKDGAGNILAAPYTQTLTAV
ncbi:MAG TPA: hypothetical protein VIJ25_04100, partial [Methylococcales bacterium]